MTLREPMESEESELGKEVMWKFWPAASGKSQHRTLGFLSKAIESVTENYSPFVKQLLASSETPKETEWLIMEQQGTMWSELSIMSLACQTQ